MYPYNPNDPFGNGQYPNQEDGSEDQGDHRNSYPGDGFVPFVTEPGGFTAPEFYPVDGTQIPYGASMQGYMSNPYVQSPFAPTMPVMVGFYDNNGFGYNQLMNALNASNTNQYIPHNQNPVLDPEETSRITLNARAEELKAKLMKKKEERAKAATPPVVMSTPFRPESVQAPTREEMASLLRGSPQPPEIRDPSFNGRLSSGNSPKIESPSGGVPLTIPPSMSAGAIADKVSNNKVAVEANESPKAVPTECKAWALERVQRNTPSRPIRALNAQSQGKIVEKNEIQQPSRALGTKKRRNSTSSTQIQVEDANNNNSNIPKVGPGKDQSPSRSQSRTKESNNTKSRVGSAQSPSGSHFEIKQASSKSHKDSGTKASLQNRKSIFASGDGHSKPGQSPKIHRESVVHKYEKYQGKNSFGNKDANTQKQPQERNNTSQENRDRYQTKIMEKDKIAEKDVEGIAEVSMPTMKPTLEHYLEENPDLKNWLIITQWDDLDFRKKVLDRRAEIDALEKKSAGLLVQVNNQKSQVEQNESQLNNVSRRSGRRQPNKVVMGPPPRKTSGAAPTASGTTPPTTTTASNITNKSKTTAILDNSCLPNNSSKNIAPFAGALAIAKKSKAQTVSSNTPPLSNTSTKTTTSPTAPITATNKVNPPSLLDDLCLPNNTKETATSLALPSAIERSTPSTAITNKVKTPSILDNLRLPSTSSKTVEVSEAPSSSNAASALDGLPLTNTVESLSVEGSTTTTNKPPSILDNLRLPNKGSKTISASATGSTPPCNKRSYNDYKAPNSQNRAAKSAKIKHSKSRDLFNRHSNEDESGRSGFKGHPSPAAPKLHETKQPYYMHDRGWRNGRGHGATPGRERSPTRAAGYMGRNIELFPAYTRSREEHLRRLGQDGYDGPKYMDDRLGRGYAEGKGYAEDRGYGGRGYDPHSGHRPWSYGEGSGHGHGHWQRGRDGGELRSGRYTDDSVDVRRRRADHSDRSVYDHTLVKWERGGKGGQ